MIMRMLCNSIKFNSLSNLQISFIYFCDTFHNSFIVNININIKHINTDTVTVTEFKRKLLNI